MPAATEPFQIKHLGTSLTEQQAREIFHSGEEAVVFALLQLAKQLQQGQAGTALGPSTPSGMKPVYQKPPASTRRKKPGRKPGHAGARRAGHSSRGDHSQEQLREPQ